MEIFVARHPIFDRYRNVYGYELLFRAGLKNAFQSSEPDTASVKVIADSLLRFGIRKMTGGKRAFINFTRDTLVKGYASLLPRDVIVVEILENVEPDEAVMDACRQLKRGGYLIALDDFVCSDWSSPLVQFADIIKVDFRLSSPAERAELASRIAARKIRPLAEKVETRAEFDEAVDLGYTYLQGYFFSKPLVLAGHDVPGSRLRYLQVLKEIHRPDLDFRQIEGIVKREPALAYKLLTYVNSAARGLRVRITSIRQALIHLGEDQIRKWASVVVLAGLAEGQPTELITTSLIRARFCEAVAAAATLEERAQELFLMGLFSLLDAMTGRPMPELLIDLPVSDDIKMALLGNRNRFRDVYNCLLAYEQGDWDTFSLIAAKLRLDEDEASRLYLDAVAWGGESVPAIQ